METLLDPGAEKDRSHTESLKEMVQTYAFHGKSYDLN